MLSLSRGYAHCPPDARRYLLGRPRRVDRLARHPLLPGRSAEGDLVAKDAAGREVLELELLLDAGRLRAFPAAGWAEDDADHCGSSIFLRRRHQDLAFSASRA